MFDRIAPRYDLLNRVLSAGIDRRWRRAAVDTLALPPGGRVLDVCTGTADLLLEAIRRGPGNRGIGVDLSVPMLARGRSKLHRVGAQARAGLGAGDAERLPLLSNVFDGAMVAFGIRNVGDPASALRELCRVLKPGGRLVVLEFSLPAGSFGRLYRLYFTHVLPRVGGLVSGDAPAYAYLPASVQRFPSPAGFESMLAASGFIKVASRALSFGIARLYEGEKAA